MQSKKSSFSNSFSQFTVKAIKSQYFFAYSKLPRHSQSSLVPSLFVFSVIKGITIIAIKIKGSKFAVNTVSW